MEPLELLLLCSAAFATSVLSAVVGMAGGITPARALIGLFVLGATWPPRRLLLGAHPERADPNRRFLALGGVVGVLNMTVLTVIALRLVSWQGF